MSEEATLHPDVAEIASKVRFDETEQQFALTDDDLLSSARRIAAPRSYADADEVARHLVALCIKYDRLAQEHARTAIAQLMVLLILLLGDRERAREAIEHAGMELSPDVAALIGKEVGKVPFATTKKSGLSLLALRLGKRKRD